MLLPLIGYTLFSWLAILAKNLHNFVGPHPRDRCLPIMIVLFVRDNLFRAYDWAVARRSSAACSIAARTCRPARPTPAQKVLFWMMVVVLGIMLCVTGLILDFPNFNQTRADDAGRQRRAHDRGARRRSSWPAGHIYLGTIGMAGALDAMRTGYVDETWARNITNTGTTMSSRGSFPTRTCGAAGQLAS